MARGFPKKLTLTNSNHLPFIPASSADLDHFYPHPLTWHSKVCPFQKRHAQKRMKSFLQFKLKILFGLALAHIGRLHSITVLVFPFVSTFFFFFTLQPKKHIFIAASRWINFNITFPIANRLITVRYTAPVDNIVWKRDALQPIGQKIVKLLYDMSFDTNPIILHVFSNGGAYLYKYIDLATKEFQSPLDVGFFCLLTIFISNQTFMQSIWFSIAFYLFNFHFVCRFVA